MTELSIFKDAYASLTVATYEPLIVRWVSQVAITQLSDTLAERFYEQIPIDATLPIEHAVDLRDGSLDPWINPVNFEAGPGDLVGPLSEHPNGMTMARMNRGGLLSRFMPNRVERYGDVPVSIGHQVHRMRHASGREGDITSKRERSAKYAEEIRAAIGANSSNYGEAVFGVVGNDGLNTIPVGEVVEEFLSPIGIAHYYRQLFFHSDEGLGPIEQAFSVAPAETVEIFVETTRRQVHEEVLEEGYESVSERAEEVRNLTEVSDKTSHMIQRDTAAAISADVGGGIGVWHASASVGVDVSSSSQRARETTTKRSKAVTTRAAERITKSATLRIADTEESVERNYTRRVVSNDGTTPISYGLRRVHRRARVKVQDLGPKLVWQLYVRDPGRGLAGSDFVHFASPADISIPDLPPGVVPLPKGGLDTGTSSVSFGTHNGAAVVTLEVLAPPGRRITGLTIESVSNNDSTDKDVRQTALRTDVAVEPASWDETTRTYTRMFAVDRGTTESVSVAYSYSWVPDKQTVDAHAAAVLAARSTIEEDARIEQFEREKALLTETSKVRNRPAADLRQEERYEVMNRMVSHLFQNAIPGSSPAPLEIESFHRYFDIDAMFIWNHPSWWRPRYAANRRHNYPVTADSEPAPLGSSLGWQLQLDGDDRRNQFLNSPWVRVCLPMRPGREREAVRFLADRIEGQNGYDDDASPLRDILQDIEGIRELEADAGKAGPDYVSFATVVNDQNLGTGVPQGPEDVYPIIDEFDVTVPTDGFVYDEITPNI